MEHENQPSDEDRLKIAARMLRDRAIPAGPSASLEQQTAARMRSNQVRGHRRLMHSRPLIAALAAAIIAAVSIGVVMFGLHGANDLAFAEVAEQVERTHTLTAKLPGEDDPHSVILVSIKGSRTRSEGTRNGKHWIFINDDQTGKMLELYPDQKFAALMQLKASGLDPYAIIRGMVDHATKSLGEKVINGRRLTGFTGMSRIPQEVGPIKPEHFNVWVDPNSKLPVRIESLSVPKPGEPEMVNDILDDLRFDVPLDDSLFSMKPPAGYTFQDYGGPTREQLQPPATTREAESLLLTPGVGVGDVKFGATSKQIIAAFGKPETTALQGMSLAYPSRGMGFLVHPKAGLQNISVYAASGVLWNAHDFPGQTSQGIRMGSTRAEVEKAYGPPDTAVGNDVQSHLSYNKLGLAINFINGKVTFIWMALPTAKP